MDEGTNLPSIAELTALVREQQRRIDEQQATIDQLVGAGSHAGDTPVVAEVATPTSRRAAFKIAGAAAAGAAASVALGGERAAADDPNDVVKGINNPTTASTEISMGSGAALTNASVLQVSDTSGTTSTYPSAVAGISFNDRAGNGLFGFAGGRDDANTSTGHGLIAWAVDDGRSHLLLVPDGADPTTDTYLHTAGEIRAAENGDLWYCHTAGTPGTWSRLAGPQTPSPDFATDIAALLLGFPLTVPISPVRVYDSRRPMGSTPNGPLAVGPSRVIPCRDGRSVETGAVTATNVIPAGAAGMLFTISIIAPSGAGFLAVNPRSVTDVTAATINFDGTSPTVLNNSSIVAFGEEGDREIRVIAGGAAGSAVDFTIDAIGVTISLDKILGGLLSDDLTSALSKLQRI